MQECDCGMHVTLFRFRAPLIPTAAGGKGRGGGRGAERRGRVGPEGIFGPWLPADPERHHPKGAPEGRPGGTWGRGTVDPLPGE